MTSYNYNTILQSYIMTHGESAIRHRSSSVDTRRRRDAITYNHLHGATQGQLPPGYRACNCPTVGRENLCGGILPCQWNTSSRTKRRTCRDWGDGILLMRFHTKNPNSSYCQKDWGEGILSMRATARSGDSLGWSVGVH